jgi:opacity-associated protein A-like protein
MPESTPPKPGLYVGYLPLPPRHRRFLTIFLPAIVFVILAAAAGIAMLERDPGPAVWDDAAEQAWTGTVHLLPYPMLETEQDGPYLIVGIGKFGVADRLKPHDGLECTIRGYQLQRSGRKMIELSMAQDAITETGRTAESTNTPTQHAIPISITTEIVDGKCFLGTMKPGNRKNHKACAILCVTGGLPPIVAANIPEANGLYPLLRVDGSTTLPDPVLNLIGEPVHIEGTLTHINGLPVLDTTAGNITPAGP